MGRIVGSKLSGQYSKNARTIAKRAEERRQDLARYLEGQDPDDLILTRSRILRMYEAQYKEAVSSSVSAQKARETFIEHYLGKPMQPVAMEMSNRTPEERVAAFMEALEILKALQADQAMKEPNGSESVN